MSDKVPPNKNFLMQDHEESVKYQKFNDMKNILKECRDKFNKYKILYNAVEDCVSQSGKLGDNLRKEVSDILQADKYSEMLELDSDSYDFEGSRLLGVHNVNDTELNSTQSKLLNEAVHQALLEKYVNIRSDFQKMTGQTLEQAQAQRKFNMFDINLLKQDEMLLDLSKQVTNEEKRYLESLLDKQKTLEEILQLRLKQIPGIAERKAEEYQLSTQMNSMRRRMLQEKAKLDILNETSHSLQAYETLTKDIKEQQEECSMSIEELQKLKEKYGQVACEQFDDILKSFKEYKSAIEKKKMFYEALLGSDNINKTMF